MATVIADGLTGDDASSDLYGVAPPNTQGRGAVQAPLSLNCYAFVASRLIAATTPVSINASISPSL